MDKFDDWVGSAKEALAWFIEIIGHPEWERRRKNVCDYFIALQKKQYRESEINGGNIDKLFSPIAVYDDWMAWYMYLLESVHIRPGVDDPFQSARVYPFFAAIGRNISSLKQMQGIEPRLKNMLNEQQNQPDSTLFELVVAALYHRNGWKVTFLKEGGAGKSPDFEVSRGRLKYWVECKRMAKVTEYAEKERAAWQKRFQHLTNAMRLQGTQAFADIIFKVPVEDTEETILGGAFYAYKSSGQLGSGNFLSSPQLDFRAKLIDVKGINERLSKMMARGNSPQFIELLAGSYDMHGSYADLIAPAEISTYGLDDGLHVLNQFFAGIHQAYAAKWECIAPASIERKAKDVKKLLSKAVEQIPSVGKGIIHIGYETLNGPVVELARHKKIQKTIQTFNFKGKQIEGVYCHALQLLSKVEEFETAETTITFERSPRKIFKETLLLDPPGISMRDSTHWIEDLFE
jgi:hypothetical protein